MPSSSSTLIGVAILLSALTGLPTEGKVIVLFSIPHAANVRTHTNVGRALESMGHDAYVCVPKFMIQEELANFDGINVIPYGDYLGNFENTLIGNTMEMFWKGETPSLTLLLKFIQTLRGTVSQILSDSTLLLKLKSFEPDLILIGNSPPFRNFVIIPYMLNVSFAYMSIYADLLGYRVPFSPAATACNLIHGFQERGISFGDRLRNTVCHAMVYGLSYMIEDDTMVAEFAPDRPEISVAQLIRQARLYLVESDEILDFAKPQLPNMKFIGSTASTPGRPLIDPFKTFAETSNQGIAVVTFGSAIVDVSEKIAKKMIAGFAQQNLNVIWRVNHSSPDPSKILTSMWIPQNDLLAHPNTKLFVSHCGANGQYEALYHGVPILCLPLHGDQFYNAARSTVKGFGRQANILGITASELADLMKDVAGNITYQNTIKQASALYRKLYKVPEQEAAFWLDHVMEYGGAYMRSAGQDMPLYQFLALDLLALLFVVVIALLLVLYWLCRRCLWACRICCFRKTFNVVNNRKKVD